MIHFLVSMDAEIPAVLVRHLRLTYGKTVVLDNMNMTVPMHTIFALLGPSGCGKTTLLKCILGRLRYKKGVVRVFGRKPGAKGSGVPGSAVGFMPQEIALFMEFTILELLFYFGTIFKMRKTKIIEKYDFLVTFLDLPTDNRPISSFSGGQQRRTSLAAALLHEPQLIVLDEPTVGVDPMLRQSIWKFLVKIASRGHTTIIITTHYVEEARQANVVGMLRGGRLLAQSGPDDLMARMNQKTLEDVFLELCIRDTKGDVTVPNVEESPEDLEIMLENARKEIENSSNKIGYGIEVLAKDGRMNFFLLPYPWAFVALLRKNLTKMRRNIILLVFQFLLPLIQIVIFFACIGREPHYLEFGIVNHDKGLGKKNFGKSFLNNMNPDTFTKFNYDTKAEALKATKDVKIWGFVVIQSNFTKALTQRFQNTSAMSNKELSDGSIHTYLDMTNQQIVITIKARLDEALARAAAEVFIASGKNPLVLKSPIVYKSPVYGDREPTFTDFMAPGVICIIISFMASGLTAMTFVQERKEGLFERTFVAGVGIAPYFLSHIVAQFLVLLMQCLVLLVIAFAFFKVPCRGNPAPMVFLTVIVGIFGMCMGFVISAACDREETAIQLTVGTAYPNILVNGIIWPRSGMPYALSKLATIFPLTLPVEALRSVMLRGLNIYHRSVWLGYVVILVWMMLLIKAVFIIMKQKGM